MLAAELNKVAAWTFSYLRLLKFTLSASKNNLFVCLFVSLPQREAVQLQEDS
jgi:hypothetical protein